MQPIKLLIAISLGSKCKADALFATQQQQQKSTTPGRARSLAAQFPKEYYTYHSAKGRCTNPRHPLWTWYGGRGIRMRLKSFEDFFLAIGPCLDPELTLDRYPNKNGDYRAGNMRWATKSEQALNRRPRVLREIAEWLGWTKRNANQNE